MQVTANKTGKSRVGPITRGYRRILIGTSISAAALTGGLVFAFWFFVGRRSAVGNTTELWGQFGDFLGGVVGTVVAAATLALVAITVLLQVRLMNLARRQLEESKKELRLTRNEMRHSNDALRQQTFESTFFRMLEQFRAYALQIRFFSATGISAFETMRSRLSEKFDFEIQRHSTSSAATKAYEGLYDEAGVWLGPYFRTLYHLHKLLHYSGLSESRRAQYASLVRAQLSRYELVILYYNLLNERSARIRPYVNFYGVLKHLDVKDLLDVEHRASGLVANESAFHDYEWRVENGIKPAPEIALPEEYLPVRE